MPQVKIFVPREEGFAGDGTHFGMTSVFVPKEEGLAADGTHLKGSYDFGNRMRLESRTSLTHSANEQ